MTGRAVLTMATRQLFDTFKVLEIEEGASPAALAEYAKARAVLLSFLPGNPKAVARLLGLPSVSTPLRHLRDRSAPVDEALVEFAGQALFELALSDELPSALRLERAPPRLISIRHRRILEPSASGLTLDSLLLSEVAPTERLRAASLDVTVSSGHDRGWSYGRGVAPSLESLVIATDVIRRALSRIEEVSETLRREVDRFLPVVAIGDDGSARASLGLGFCAPRADPDEMAEALVRAAGRQKMHAFVELDSLVLQGEVLPFFEAQERAVAASLHAGLLRLGSKASREREARLRRDLARLLENVPSGDDLTPAGAAVLAELRRHREG